PDLPTGMGCPGSFRCFRTPACSATISTVALSDSISRIKSPTFTAAPSGFAQLRMLTSVIDSPTFGARTLCFIVLRFRCSLVLLHDLDGRPTTGPYERLFAGNFHRLVLGSCSAQIGKRLIQQGLLLGCVHFLGAHGRRRCHRAPTVPDHASAHVLGGVPVPPGPLVEHKGPRSHVARLLLHPDQVAS